MSNIKCYKVKCITNLHVGDGEANYNIIDNEIERDPVNEYPMIFSTGVKGALREHFKGICSQNQSDNTEENAQNSENGDENKEKVESKDIIVDIFGSDNKSKDSLSGNLKFLNAYLLAIPMRASQGDRSFYMVTSVGLLQQLLDLEMMLRPTCASKSNADLETLNKVVDEIRGSGKCVSVCTKQDKKKEQQEEQSGGNTFSVEGISSIESFDTLSKKETNDKQIFKDWIKRWLDEDNIIILNENEMRNYRYPMQARNQLENGKSKNLWYEEYVPHESIFYTYVIAMPNKEKLLGDFSGKIKDNSLVQFGGNATVGFGLTKMTEMVDEKAQENE